MQRFFVIFLMILLAFIIAILPNPAKAKLQAAPLPGGQPIPTPTVAATVTTAAAVSLLPTITPTPRSADLLPAPLYFLAPDQQIWQLTGSATNLISQTITHEPWPIVSFDFSPIHGRFVYITDNQLVEFDPKTNTRIVKIKGPALPPTQADGRYTIGQSGTLVLGTPRYAPDGTQIAYTQAGVNLVRSGFEGTTAPQRLLRNVLWLQSLMTPLASTIDWTTNVGEIRLYGGEMIWSPDGKKLLFGYTGWEWYGYEIYDQATASLVSLPIGVNGEWQWRKDNGMGIVANSGYGGVFDSGLFLVDAQNGTSHRLDLTPLGITVEENPFTPLAHAAYESPAGVISFFMGTKFLSQDNQHSIFYALAEINLATNALSWVQAEENRQEVELGEVLWAADGSGVVNARASTPLQWLPVDGSPAIDLGIIGNNLRWGTTPTAEITVSVPTFTATPADLVTPPAPTFAPATPLPNLEQRIGDYTLRIWKGMDNSYSTHLPNRGIYGTATLTHDEGSEIVIADAIDIQPLPTSDINGDGYPDLALQLRSGGSHCCFGTAVYTLDNVPTKLLSMYTRRGEFADLDQDGIYEFITRDYARHLPCSGSSAVTVLRYDPVKGYVGSSYLFSQVYEEILARPLTRVNDMCDVGTITLDYLYMGLPIQAWAEFTRLYSGDQDIFSFHEQMERSVFEGELFAAKPPGVQTMNDFAVDQAGQLNQLVQINDAAGVNQATIRLSPYKNGAGDPLDYQFLELNYTIQGAPGQRYVGIERCFVEEQNWSQTPILDLAIRNPTDQPVAFFLQFGEGKRCGNESFPGEVWRTAVTLQPYESRILTLPLDSAQTFARTGWSPQQNGQIDLQQVGYFAIGVETAEPQPGVLQISSIRLWP